MASYLTWADLSRCLCATEGFDHQSLVLQDLDQHVSRRVGISQWGFDVRDRIPFKGKRVRTRTAPHVGFQVKRGGYVRNTWHHIPFCLGLLWARRNSRSQDGRVSQETDGPKLQHQRKHEGQRELQVGRLSRQAKRPFKGGCAILGVVTSPSVGV